MNSFIPGKLLTPINQNGALLVHLKEDGNVTLSKELTTHDIVLYINDASDSPNIINVIYDGIIFRTNRKWYKYHDE